MIDYLLPILVLLLILWFWLDSLRARELAIGICRAACARRDVQFLDQTVVLLHLGVRRTADGLRLRRVYGFEFSEEGVGRRSGHLVLLALNIEKISLGLPEHPADA